MTEEKKKRRIAGNAYWTLKSSLEKIEKLATALREWRDEQAKKLEVYPYQMNWGLGVIYEEDSEIVNAGGREMVTKGKVLKKIPQEVLDEDKAKRDEIQASDSSVGKYRDKLAKKLKVLPEDIDLKTGVVTEGVYEDIDVNVDEEPKATAKRKAKDD